MRLHLYINRKLMANETVLKDTWQRKANTLRELYNEEIKNSTTWSLQLVIYSTLKEEKGKKHKPRFFQRRYY